MAKNNFQFDGLNYYTLQCGTIMTLISPAYCTLQCGMWSGIMTVDYQVAAPCNVTRSSGIMTLNSPAPCNGAGGSGMTCHGIRQNVRRIGILHLVSILTISPQSTCHSAPVCEILSKSDHPQQKKNKNLAIANRLRVSCAHNTLRASMGLNITP